MSNKLKKNRGIGLSKIGEADSVTYSNNECTYCHSDCEGIFLTPEDMYNISCELQLTPIEVFERYCWGTIDGFSCVPTIFLRTCYPCSSVGRCPFLNNGQCGICKSKPSICTFPPIEDEMEPERLYTISECLMINGVRCKNDFLIQLQNDFAEIGEMLYILDKVADHDFMKKVWSEIYIDLYLRYDPKQDFMPQYEKNVQKQKDLLPLILSDYELPL